MFDFVVMMKKIALASVTFLACGVTYGGFVVEWEIDYLDIPVNNIYNVLGGDVPVEFFRDDVTLRLSMNSDDLFSSNADIGVFELSSYQLVFASQGSSSIFTGFTSSTGQVRQSTMPPLSDGVIEVSTSDSLRWPQLFIRWIADNPAPFVDVNIPQANDVVFDNFVVANGQPTLFQLYSGGRMITNAADARMARFHSFSSVPEPSSYHMLALAMVGCIFGRCRHWRSRLAKTPGYVDDPVPFQRTDEGAIPSVQMLK